MSEYTGKNKKDLMKSLAEKRAALQDFRYELAGGKAKNVKKGKNIRKEIAQIMTELTIAHKAEAGTAPAVTKVKTAAVKKAKPAKAAK